MSAGGMEHSPDFLLVQSRQCVQLRQDGIVDDKSSPRLERSYQLPQNFLHIRIRPIMKDPVVQIDISGNRLLFEHVVGHERHPIGKLRRYDLLVPTALTTAGRSCTINLRLGERVG